jgi:probable HAF family extracellular repeat protein
MKLLVTLFCAAGVAGASVIYTVTDLGSLGGTAAQAFSLNASGEAAGFATTRFGYTHAITWSGGNLTDLTQGTGASEGIASSINASGRVAGTQYINGQPYATVWTGGAPQAIGGAGSFATAINDGGVAAGMLANGHAFTTANGDLGTLPGGSWTSAYAINAGGNVAGYGDVAPGVFRAFVWTPTTGYVVLETFGGANGYAMAINNAGDVAGSAQLANGYVHAFIESDGVLHDLGTLGLSSYAYGINNSGVVVGYSYTGSDPDPHAFLYQNGVLLDLNSLIDPSAGWVLTQAYGINDRGEIVGAGLFKGVEHAFLLDPVHFCLDTSPAAAAVPEPGTRTLAMAGVLLIVSSRIRSRLRPAQRQVHRRGEHPR